MYHFSIMILDSSFSNVKYTTCFHEPVYYNANMPTDGSPLLLKKNLRRIKYNTVVCISICQLKVSS